MMKLKNVIKEINVTDLSIQRKIEEFANLSEEIDRVKSQLKGLESKYKVIADELIPVIEKASDNALKTEKLTAFIKKKGFERVDYKYKEAMLWLYERVNATMKHLVDDAKEATKTITKIAPQISVQRNEGIGDIWRNLKNSISIVIRKIRGYNHDIELANNKLEEVLRKIGATKPSPEVFESFNLSSILKEFNEEDEIISIRELENIAKKYDLSSEFSSYDPGEISVGYKEEKKEHATKDGLQVAKNDGDILKIVFAHLAESPKYYSKLSKIKI